MVEGYACLDMELPVVVAFLGQRAVLRRTFGSLALGTLEFDVALPGGEVGPLDLDTELLYATAARTGTPAVQISSPVGHPLHPGVSHPPIGCQANLHDSYRGRFDEGPHLVLVLEVAPVFPMKIPHAAALSCEFPGHAYEVVCR
ncbi:MAG: hypothetical protein ABSD97_08830 [Acidimicrobiales bacterium]